MPKKKKIDRYVPATQFPSPRREWGVLSKVSTYDDFYHCYDLYVNKLIPNYTNKYVNNFFQRWHQSFTSGNNDVKDWKNLLGYSTRNLLQAIWPVTPEFEAINDAFMKEYDEREDLQEVYKEAYPNSYYIYDKYGNHHERLSEQGVAWSTRPETYMMFKTAVENSHEVRKKIELARQTPYQEGDLVLLRDPYIGHRRHDPLYKHEWNPVTGGYENGPGPEVQRIGTVISVTEKTGDWRSGKGTKIIQLIWACKDEPTLEEVEEKYIKWHMRPTYKNGLKVRDEEK